MMYEYDKHDLEQLTKEKPFLNFESSCQRN